jgi:prepilin peptidase CpaA
MSHTYEFVYPAAASVCALVAAIFDVRSRRIPNLLTGPALVLALCLHLALDGWQGMFHALAAGLICGAVFFVFYMAGGMGAGDVKLIAAAACFAGLHDTAYLLCYTAIVGGVMALALALLRGRLGETLANVVSITRHHLHEGLTPHPDLNVRNQQQLRLPYGVAIAAGCLLTIWLHRAQG